MELAYKFVTYGKQENKIIFLLVCVYGYLLFHNLPYVSKNV